MKANLSFKQALIKCQSTFSKRIIELFIYILVGFMGDFWCFFICFALFLLLFSCFVCSLLASFGFLAIFISLMNFSILFVLKENGHLAENKPTDSAGKCRKYLCCVNHMLSVKKVWIWMQFVKHQVELGK